ncbi:hypothetical protein LSCM4_01209 [Leishmania orientalis]|uniref:FAM13A-like domain-containing protein n=1 Tax=Leishmania orientalis TaxID=2249476 RepID=A0A836KBF6_9TRYP|nr:hypothetical protein LSCM4_01209 [Leishmania orientalis]
MVADPLSQILSQVIDDVSFSQTHTVSDDFRVYPKSSIDSVSTLQQEQRRRVEQTYGARAPSPDFLGSQLLAEYRGEAASLQLAKESGDPNFPTTVSRMTPEQTKQFKKDMKQRIHEWEATVRDATGQTDVYPDQKAALRAIYELYRATKMRVLGVEAPAGPHGAAAEPSVAGGRDVSQSIAAQAAGAPSAPASTVGGTRADSTRSSSSAAKDGTVGFTKAPSRTPAAANGEGRSASSGASAPATAGSGADWIQRIERVPLGTENVSIMSEEALQVEKRSLKQVLHRFESDFEKYNGVRPGRHDRHGFTAEYHRYGELKNELARRSQK